MDTTGSSDFSRHPRHRRRALGRIPLSHDQVRDGEELNGAAASSGNKAARLLNFLSRTAAQAERSLLKPESIPDFATIKTPAELSIAFASQSRAHSGRTRKPTDIQKSAARSTLEDGSAALETGRASQDQNQDHLQQAEEYHATMFQGLADSLAIEAGSPSPPSGPESATVDAARQSLERALEFDPLAADSLTRAERIAVLDDWFNCRADSANLETDADLDSASARVLAEALAESLVEPPLEPLLNHRQFPDPLLSLSMLPAALPAVIPHNDYDDLFSDLDPEERSDNWPESRADSLIERSYGQTGARRVQEGQKLGSETDELCALFERAERSSPVKAESGFGQRTKDKRLLFKRLLLDKSDLRRLPGGKRMEAFEDGSTLIKDALGRVVEVRSSHDICLFIDYDQGGQPQGFVRTAASGERYSSAERDQHGVVVRDRDGRVRAQGEVMVIDPRGCLNVTRYDGQFWSLDLVHGLHIERRSLLDSEGRFKVLTAVFTADGFRMMTRFQTVRRDGDESAQPRKQQAGKKGSAGLEGPAQRAADGSDTSGSLRFYGRDGSVIQFEGEDDLTDLKPSSVSPPGSRHIDKVWRYRRQARTAWDSVQEYVFSYLSA